MSSTAADNVLPLDALSGPAVAAETTDPNGAATSGGDGQADDATDSESKNAAACPSGDSDNALARRALDFLSTATPGTLGGIAVGVTAVTYFTLGGLGLLLIGAVGGALGFVAWEARNPDVARAVRGERGADILERVWLEFKSASADSKDSDNSDDHDDAAIKSFEDFRPETRDALGGLVDALIRDYVKWWYNPIVPSDHSFPLACRKTFTSYVLAISNHLYRKRPADVYLDLLTNSSSILIVFMSELATAFAEVPPEANVNAADTLYNYLASNPDSRLANLLNQRQQAAKFKTVAEDLLRFLDRNSFNCDPARIFTREILASSVLEATLQRCSKADWINGWIVYLLEAGEPDLSQAIDVGMQSGRDAGHTVFTDLDGNIGNISIAKPMRSPAEAGGRRKDSLAHRKKLSKADEELEVAMEEMKRMNAMIAKEDERRKRESGPIDNPEQFKESMERTSVEGEKLRKSMTNGETSPTSGHPRDISSRGTSTDGLSSKGEVVQTPITPRSTLESSSQTSSPRQSGGGQFTSFDQIVPNGQGDGSDEEPPAKAPLTLHNASFTLHDDATGGKEKIRNKPAWDYLLQVEPQSAHYPGWMIVRRYSDFETLHEILRRIANISGATAFTELHKELPSWKMHTRESLRGELERYLRDACWYQSLAESEGMKRFLEKSQSHTHGTKTFDWDAVGKNMLDVLNIAPKGAMDGGRTLVGGVSGMFGNLPGLSRKSTSQSVDLTLTSASRLSISTPPRLEPMMSPARSPARSERTSMDSQRSSVISTQPGKMAPMGRTSSFQSQAGDADTENAKRGRLERADSYISVSASARPSREHSRASSMAAARSPSMVSLDQSRLPPLPDEIPDDYGAPEEPRLSLGDGLHLRQASRSGSLPPGAAGLGIHAAATKKKVVRQYTPLTEPETRVAVELVFAIINEMYTLSSAWNIRRTLLTAAKSFLLRPGNPSLLTVQSLMQSSLLDGNSSDAGIAAHLRKLRENTMPTDQERATWPAELTADEKEKLAAKARKLLIQSGVPAALMGVMGQAATGEALGRVFDCLQVEEVARGLIFGLMLQAVRVVTH